MEVPLEKDTYATQDKAKVRTLPYLISQYIFLLSIAFIILLAFLNPWYHPAQIYHSKEATHPWDSNSDPLLFTHVTDIHLAESEPFKVTNTILLLQYMKYYNTSFHLISGDIVDNYGEKNWPKIGHQVQEDWVLWKALIEDVGFQDKIIDIAGNHDMWGIDDPLSDHNLFLDYSYTYNRTNTPTLDSFFIRSIVRDNITFVLINNYRFPSIHPPYIYWPHPDQTFLDLIEEFIDNINGKCYVVCHYPVDYNWNVRSSKGHTFNDIMENEKIEALFSGHFHPPDVMIIHHKQGAVEYIGPGAYQRKAFGIVSIDNGRFVYHTINLTKIPKHFLLTHPIPLQQLSSHQIFNERDTEIRLLSYAKKNVTIRISGDINGVLKYSRKLKNGADLYTYPIHLQNGKYKIHLSGDGCNITREFVIGDNFKGDKDLSSCYHRGLNVTRFCLIPIILYVIWITFPFNGNENKDTEDWIKGKTNNNNLKNWLIVIFLSPNLIRTRMLKLPKLFRYVLFAFMFYPFVLPHHLFKPIFGLYGYSFLCFIVIGKKIMFDNWAVHMTLFYYVLIICPFVFYVSSLKLRYKCEWIYKWNRFLCFLLLFGVCVINYRWVGESVIIPLLFVNPSFVLVPICLHSAFYLIVIKNKKKIDQPQFDVEMDPQQLNERLNEI
ncbi:Ser/Thr protein phosphatase [Histomonas meleagridis]|uniref:Ser/Thr protein phosphatase n=1 Tax=Histomonas meleagridis TaxID=135588 RepID=UPI00355A8EF0|nr:Ser/Thr protein phosphatase [Histomonas meleagridis]KAH0806089.1 Ser/Thr protein phosphatase [Histomonas meleagridis]